MCNSDGSGSEAADATSEISAQGDRYEAFMQTVSDPICLFDDAWRIYSVNDAFEQRTGFSAEEALGQDGTLVLDRETVERARSTVVTLRETGSTTETLETTLTTKDGHSLQAVCHLSVLASDSPLSAAVFRDITQQSESANHLEEFATVVSHDLRNPLDVALGRAEILTEIADVDPETEQHLDEIYNSLKRMERLIEDALTLTHQRVEQVETASVEFAAVATAAWRTVDTGAATLTVDTDVTILAHESRLLRLLENLFRNAVEHAGTDVAVHVGSFETGVAGEIGLYVADDGPGVAPKAREEIFDDGYTTCEEGTGLGLAIVREITRLHGWTVDIADSDRTGSNTTGARFEFTGVEVVR